MTSSVLVIFHKHCADGAGAAWAAWRRFGEQAEYRPAQYGEPAPTDEEVAGRQVFILDFSYDQETTLRLARAAELVTVIDHHPKSESVLLPLVGTVPNLIVRFDAEHSGAVLAWQQLCPMAPGEVMPWFLPYIEDRDLWRWQLPDSREISAALFVRGLSENFHHEVVHTSREEFVAEGDGILRAQDFYARLLATNAMRVGPWDSGEVVVS